MDGAVLGSTIGGDDRSRNAWNARDRVGGTSLALHRVMSRLAASLLLLAVLVPGCASTGAKVAAGAFVASTAIAVATYDFEIFCNPGDGPLGPCPENNTSRAFGMVAVLAAFATLVIEVGARTPAHPPETPPSSSLAFHPTSLFPVAPIARTTQLGFE